MSADDWPKTPRQGDPCGSCGHSTFFPRWSADLGLWLCLPCQAIEDSARWPITPADLAGDPS